MAGIDEAKEELQEVVEFLSTPDKFQKLGGRIPKGVLLVGPPGTGKTLLARAVAGEAKVPFFSISGSEFVEMFVGVGAARVRDLFSQATAQAPCIIFIDELDALGKARGVNVMGGHDEQEQTLNQLLVEMDGFETNKGVIIMAATNRPEILDPALLRPGRFDRQVLVDRPDINGREAILKIHSKNVLLGPDVDLRKIAGRTPGFVGADLANLINEAALLAARKNKEIVELADLDEAIDRVVGGLQKKTRVMNPQEKEIVAFHESGHAIVAESVEHADPVHKISIIPRGIAALGYTQQQPTEDRYLMTRSELLDRLAVFLGGRVAEELVFKEISTGAQNDLQRATDIARSMVAEYGMSDRLGLVTYERPRQSMFLPEGFSQSKTYSEEKAGQIDEEVARVIEEAHQRVKGILLGRRKVLDDLAHLLSQQEIVQGEELRKDVVRIQTGKGRLVTDMNPLEEKPILNIQREKTMKVLLVYPNYPDTFWSFKHALSFISKRAVHPPLGLLTVAAMLPEEWEKRLVDMNVSDLKDQDLQWADYVFISAMTVQKKSAREVISRCKRKGVKIVAGGPLFTAAGEDFPEVDHLVLDEAETTLPPFLKDLGEGQAEHLYTSKSFPNLENTPIPLWKLVEMKRYVAMNIQYSRGCPFSCEFCDITTLFGHKARTKSVSQVLDELESLYALGWRGGVFFVDDNFIGNKKKLKEEVLPAMNDWMKKRRYPFNFATEVSIDLADDDELIRLMTRTGFDNVFVGIETPDDQALKECRKFQNRNRDLISSVEKIQSSGLNVRGGFIVGFDNDSPEIFERQIEFIQKSKIITAMVGMLNAPLGSRLYERLQKEGRLLKEVSGDNTDFSTNIIPKMGYEKLAEGYRKIVNGVYSPRSYYERVKGYLRDYRPPEKKKLHFHFRIPPLAFFVSRRSFQDLCIIGYKG